MKILISIVFVVFAVTSNIAQIAQYDFHVDKAILHLNQDSLVNEKDLKAHISDLKIDLDKSTFANEQYWLNNRLAFSMYLINDMEYEQYAVNAYAKNSERYCREFLEYNLLNTSDSMTTLKHHYLEISESEKLIGIRETCIKKYEKSERYKYNRKREKEEMAKVNSKYNKAFFYALQNIGVDDQRERKNGDNVDWDLQNKLDASNRIKLDSLIEIYGMPTADEVSSEGLKLAFMVLHHSTDCDWNKKMTQQFIELSKDIEEYISQLFSFYMFRNYNQNDGVCKVDDRYLHELSTSKDSTFVKKYLDFEVWKKRFNKK